MKIKNYKPLIPDSTIASRIESFLFYSLVFLIPTQLGKHFWPDFAYVRGIRIDYLSPTVYLTDLLVLFIFVLWLPRAFGKGSRANLKLKTKNLKKSKLFLFLMFIVVFLVINILISGRRLGSLYSLFKLLEMAFVAYYSAKFIVSKNIFQKIIFALSFGAITESVIAITQFLNKGSIGRLLYFLGERSFNSGTPGIANASLNGELVLRAYGTLPHPNVLAGYLLVAMILVLFSLKFQKLKKEAGSKKQEASLVQRMINLIILNSSFLIQATTLALGTIALFLTMSRIAIVAWMVVLIWFWISRLIPPLEKDEEAQLYGRIEHDAFWNLKKDRFKIKMAVVLIFISGIISIFIFSPIGSRFTNIKTNDEAIVQRTTLIDSSVKMIGKSPLIGVGLGQFLPSLAEIQKPLTTSTYLQPVHNIFLLVAAETGLIGLGLFIWFLTKTFYKVRSQKSEVRSTLLIVLSAILIIGIFDHYWLTLQQGQLLFAFVIGLCWIKVKNKNYLK